MVFLLAVVSLDMAQVLGFIFVFLLHFSDVGCNGWMISLPASLVPFVFLRHLYLGLRLRLTYISRRGSMARLSLVISMVSTKLVLLGGSVTL